MNTATIRTLGTGIIYRNPVPHLVSRHGYFPSLVRGPGDVLEAAFVIGEAFESVDAGTYTSLSVDGGRSWAKPVPIGGVGGQARLTSNCARITCLGETGLVAMMVRSDRSGHPGEGLANPETMGFVPTELLLFRRRPETQEWSGPEPVAPPLEGPSFEACSPIVVLRGGRWIWPTSTWRGWDDPGPGGMRMVALVSEDKGRTWPQFMNVMDGRKERIVFWEGKIVELADGQLLAAAWTYDEANGRDLPNHYTISADGGRNWLPPASTGIQGQTLTLGVGEGGKIWAVYRRIDRPGLWINAIRLLGHSWVNESETCLWGGSVGTVGKPHNMVHEFNTLRFGAPSLLVMDDGVLFVSFWCYGDMIQYPVDQSASLDNGKKLPAL